MKKILFAFLLILIVIGIWLNLNKQPNPHLSALPTIKTSAINRPSLQVPETNSSVANPPSGNPPPTTQITEPQKEVINALTATNLEQWKSIIKGLKYSDTLYGDRDNWVMEQRDTNKVEAVMFEENGRTISYKVRFIDVTAYKDGGKTIEVEMQTPDMNIDETRKLGLQLCNMLQIDPTGFLAWCDKVGNRWMDQPLFGERDGQSPYSFNLLHTFNHERPWYINFIIQNP